MSRSLAWPEERLRRAQRDWEEYRRRSLARRSQARFHGDLTLVPHLFLAKDALRVAALQGSRPELLAALAGRATWTLDTAVRLAGLPGFLAASDLTGYLDEAMLATLREAGLIGNAEPAAVGVDPLLPRPPLLIARLQVAPPRVTLPAGQRVVTWAHLVRDVMGTLGWRPDLLTRLEARYRAATEP